MGLGEEVVGRLRAWVEGANAEDLRDRMAQLCDMEGAIDLRLGEYLVMLFDQFDLRKLGALARGLRERSRAAHVLPGARAGARRGDGRVAAVGGLSGIATEDNVARWLVVAKRVGVTELNRAVRWAEESTSAYVLGLYEHGIEETQDAHTWVALKAARRRTPRPPRRIESVHPDLYEACVWYDAEVQLPNPKGFPAVRVREGFACENPLCNCMTLRGEGHHRDRKKDGGTNARSNAAHLCEPCHQRGVHNGGFRLERDLKGRDLWTFPTGRRVMVF